MVALLYNPPGNPHKRSVCSHIIDTGSEEPWYSFDRVVQRLADPPNVIFDEAELISREELDTRYWVGYLAVVVMPVFVWEALPTSGWENEFEMNGSYFIRMVHLGLHWILAHPLPEGWILETLAFDPRELGIGKDT